MKKKILEWLGVITAIAYSMLVASNTGYEVLGFVLLFISAILIGVWADSAYRSKEAELNLKEMGYRSKVQHKGQKNKTLSPSKSRTNTRRGRFAAE